MSLKKLTKDLVEDLYPISSIQRGLLFHYLQDRESDIYFQQLVLELTGDIDVSCVKKAWEVVVKSNQALRSFLVWKGLKEPLIVVLRKSTVDFKEVPLSLDLVDLVEEKSDTLLDRLLKDERKDKFDFAEGPLFRVRLFNAEYQKYYMLLSYPHIIMDGWSMGVILKEFIKNYRQIYQGKENLPLKSTQLKEYYRWQQSLDLTQHKNYWKEQLAGFTEKTLLNVPKSSEAEECSGNCSINLSEKLVEDIRTFGLKNGITVSSIMYSVFGILLHKYTNSRDLVFGTTVSGRNEKIRDIEELVGLFINTIPLRITIHDQQSVLQTILEVNHTLRVRQSYEGLALEEIRSLINWTPQESLFDYIMVIENYPLEKIFSEHSSENLQVESYAVFEKTNFDLTINVLTFDGIQVTFNYNKQILDFSTVERLMKHFVNLLTRIANDPCCSINSLELLTLVEKVEILHNFNDTSYQYSPIKPIHQIFEEQVRKTPEQIAVINGDEIITYSRLNELSNQLANVLREKGVREETIVGVMLERSMAMIIGLMAILKSGGAYMPINPTYPEERIQYMLEDSQARYLLSVDTIANFSGEVIDPLDPYIYNKSKLELVSAGKSNNLMYVIYTSGSTGRPKGVMVEHKSVVNRLYWMQRHYPLYPGETLLLKTSFTFDVSVWELFWWFFNNGRLALLPPRGEMSPKILLKTIETNQVTAIHFVPSMLRTFLNYLEEFATISSLQSLRHLFSSGEVLSLDLVNKFRRLFAETQTRLHNLYGPTEATVDVSYYDCPVDEKIDCVPIGKPIDNVKLYVLNDQLQLQPIGVEGELYISGPATARGYLKQAKLTEARFLPNPYGSGIMYKTGDRVRWLSDGNLEYLGRNDQQVKIRGFRIELGEIESQLSSHTGIRRSVVLVKEDLTSNYLIAFIEPESDVHLTAEYVISYLRSKLPDYMIPSEYVFTEDWPLNPHGKLDQRRLLETSEALKSSSSSSDTETVDFTNHIEEKLASLWSEVLGVVKVGREDNFFELGGHSLNATSLILRIYREFGQEISISELFAKPTIKGLAKLLNGEELIVYPRIPVSKDSKYYPLSPAQKRLYLLHQLEEINTSYNMPGVVMIEGELDSSQLEFAFKKMIERHDSLRTAFLNNAGEPVQQIIETVRFKLEHLNFSEVEIAKDSPFIEEEELSSLFEELITPFDLTKPPLLRAWLIKTSDRYLLFFDMHHIISDGTSIRILIDELIALYNYQHLPELRIQYKDYAVWHSQYIEDRLAVQENYWLNEFQEEVPVLDLPTDYQRPTQTDFKGDKVIFTVPQLDWRGLQELAQRIKATPYMVLLAGINILLARYANQTDIVVGTPIADRMDIELEKIIGMFANTLALRNKPTADKTIIEFLTEVKEKAITAYEHQDYPFERLVEKLNLARDLSRNPLFDVLFVLQNTGSLPVKANKLDFTFKSVQTKAAKFDLTFSAEELKGELRFELEYKTELFKRETVEKMSKHLLKIFNSMITIPELEIGRIELLSESAKEQLISPNTEVNSANFKRLEELFAEQVAKSPDEVALVFQNETLTYYELNTRSINLAEELRRHGVKAGQIVAIMLPPSLEMIISILAVLKSGCAFLPLDLEYPVERIKYMLNDSKAETLVSIGSLLQKIRVELGFQQPIIVINQLKLEETASLTESSTNDQYQNHATDLLYLIYTSGSTGKPKGVMLEQRNLVNLIMHQYKETNLNFKSVLQFNNLSFDVSYQEIFSTLLAGGKLYLLPKEIKTDLARLFKIIEQQKIKTLFLPTAFLRFIFSEAEFADRFPKTVEHIITAGEQLIIPAKLREYLRENSVYLHNHYGPSETHVVTTLTLDPTGEIPTRPSIGRPITNTQIYIVNTYGQLQPQKVVGELWIAGQAVGRGYLNQEELTHRKFGNNPYHPRQRIYRTGDLARWLADGNIEFIGRSDHQLKLRGYLVEPDEIAVAMLEISEIKDALVVDLTDFAGERYLCGYYVAESPLTDSEIRTQLKTVLPDYMIPAYFVALQKIPLTANGKVERKALPEPKLGLQEPERRIPTSYIEANLLKIWSEILGVESLSLEDNFFTLGGHSLRAFTMTNQIRKSLHIDLSLAEIFKRPTIKELSAYIEDQKRVEYTSIDLVESMEDYPLSSAQKRMFLMSQLNHQTTAYNIPVIALIDGTLDRAKFERTFQQLIQRHEMLRTKIMLKAGEARQQVLPTVDFEINYLNGHQEELEVIIAGCIRPFDLLATPLFRVTVVELTEKKYALICDVHHIIFDGVSLNILIRDLTRLYVESELPELRINYKDYAFWQQRSLQTPRLQKQEQYWLEQLAGDLPTLKLPYDQQQAVREVGNTIYFKINEALTQSLIDLASAHHATLYVVLLAIYNVLLYKWTQQEDIIVGSPIANRPHPDLENLIGVFINTLALRNRPSGEKSFEEFLKEVRDTAFSAYENQEYPFEELVSKLSRQGEGRENSLLRTMFVMQSNVCQYELPDMKITAYEYINKTYKFPILLSGTKAIAGLIFNLEYAAERFEQGTMEQFIRHYIKIIEIVTARPAITLAEIELLNAGEKDQILSEIVEDDEEISFDFDF